jgi:hypothetical protein
MFYARSKTMKSKFLIPALLAAVTLSTSAFARDRDDRRDHRRWEEQRQEERRDHRRWEEQRYVDHRDHRRWEEQRHEHWRHHEDYQRAYAPPPPPPAYYPAPTHYYAEPMTIRVPVPPLILPPSPREVEHTLRDLLHGR